MKVIVSCSGKFHAFALVEQLEKNGVEVIFFTAYSSIVNTIAKNFVHRIDREEIRSSTIRTNMLIALAFRLFRNNPQFVNNLFDHWVSRSISNIDADFFIGWSGMSLNSIKMAKKRGCKTILERGSTHIEFQNEILKSEYSRRGVSFEINGKTISKELLEYQFVDSITIPSKFVHQTFILKGFLSDKLFINSFGASDYFMLREKRHTTPFRVLYLGTFSIRKGAYYLYDSILDLAGRDIEFWLVGSVDDEVEFLKQELSKLPNVKFWGHVNHYNLHKFIDKCTVAVHPSIEEGQSMVINQVMKVGVPYIATANSGAEELILHMNNGVIIPANSSASITEAIINFMDNPLLLDEITTRVEQMNLGTNNWNLYGSRYIEFLNMLNYK